MELRSNGTTPLPILETEIIPRLWDKGKYGSTTIQVLDNLQKENTKRLKPCKVKYEILVRYLLRFILALYFKKYWVLKLVYRYRKLDKIK